MRLAALSLLLALTSPALAYPLPAGTCAPMDDGVAQVGPTPGQRPDAPHILSMALPRMGNGVADVTFRIGPDGAVSELKVLCARGLSGDWTAAFEKAAKTWRFAPMKREGQDVASSAAYRITSSGAVPLNFVPSGGLRKLEG